MRIYQASSEETLHAGKLLKDWASEAFVTQEQYALLKPQTVSELRTTNIFLRIVLFLFTVIIVGAVGGLFGVTFLKSASDGTLGIFLLLYAAICYATAEAAASRWRLYRYGIEEALAVCSVACLCLGMQLAFISGRPYSAYPDPVRCLVPVAGAVGSLWIWRRFGLWYAFPAAMIFALFVPDRWTWSHTARHVIVALLYAIGILVLITLRSRQSDECLEHDYPLAEAFLWLGLYLTLNLQLPPLALRAQWLIGGITPASEFSRPFYWTTWVLIWLLPPLILTRGIRKRDRFVMAVGTITAVLTFVTNKPYLGWSRHTWDPMLLGIVLAGVALFVRRWLVHGPGGIRHGFTAARLSGKDKQWMNVSSTVLGLAIPQAITPAPQPRSEAVRFGGGASGGAGAGGKF